MFRGEILCNQLPAALLFAGTFLTIYDHQSRKQTIPLYIYTNSSIMRGVSMMLSSKYLGNLRLQVRNYDGDSGV